MECQKISEYVGMGHPDRVADHIAAMSLKFSKTAATEVMINKKGCFISGETIFKSKYHKRAYWYEVQTYLNYLAREYNRKLPWFFNIKLNFVKQDKMLADRKKELKAGDQEVVYYSKLKSIDAHFQLKELDEKINKITKTCDYKILLNLENETANISISKDHYYSLEVETLILKKLKDRFSMIDINICRFKGGSFFNDTGITGRKIIVDQSGCGFPHGGGAIFGKDLTKTAPAGLKIAKKYARENDLSSVVVVFYPGDKLNKPNYIKGQK